MFPFNLQYVTSDVLHKQCETGGHPKFIFVICSTVDDGSMVDARIYEDGVNTATAKPYQQ